MGKLESDMKCPRCNGDAFLEEGYEATARCSKCNHIDSVKNFIKLGEV